MLARQIGDWLGFSLCNDEKTKQRGTTKGALSSKDREEGVVCVCGTWHLCKAATVARPLRVLSEKEKKEEKLGFQRTTRLKKLAK